MTKQFQNIFSRFSLRASARRVMLLLAVLMVGVNAWGWTGVDPFDYYFLRNRQASIDSGASKYLYVLSSESSKQWFGVTNTTATATPFVVNKYDLVNSVWPNTFMFVQIVSSNPKTFWLGENKGNTQRSEDVFWWNSVSYSSGFQLQHNSDENRRLNEGDATTVNVPKMSEGWHTWDCWTLEPHSDNATKSSNYYLYNVGTGKFLVFHDDGTGDIKAYTTQTPSFASLVTINKNAVTPIKTTLSGTDYYLYHENGTNTKSLNAFNFTIIPKKIGSVSGYHLQSKNTDYDRLAFASDLHSYVTFEQKGTDNHANDSKGLWLFIPQSEMDAYVNKSIPGIPHVQFTMDKNKFNDCKVVTFVSGNAVWDDANSRIQMNDDSPSGITHNNSLVISFLGIPDKISFNVSVNWGLGGTTNFHVRESVDGVNWSETIWDKSSSDEENVELQLQTNTRFVKLEYNGRGYGYYKNVKITEFHQFKAEKSTINFGAANVNEHPAQLLSFLHANAGSTVTVTSSSDLFTVTPSPLLNTGTDIIGVEICEIVFHPDKASAAQMDTECSETITFHDGINPDHVVTVKGIPTNKNVPKFTWNGSNLPYYSSPMDTTYYIPNILSSTNTNAGAAITYESSNNEIAFVRNDTLFIKVKNNVTPQPDTITVTQNAITGWYAHTEKFIFTPRKKVDLHVPFMVTKELFDNAFDKGSKLGYKWDESDDVKLGGDDAHAWPWFDVPSTVYDAKYIIFEFDGTPDSLFFQYRTNNKSASEAGWIGTPPNWYVYESATEVFSGAPIWQHKRSESTFADTAIKLSPETRYVKLVYQGNFAGYFKNISFTAYDGCYFVKTGNKYLSRGGDGRNKGVVDDYGIAVRKTRSSNRDNSQKYTHFQFMDNNKYLAEDADGNVITNVTSRRFFAEEKESDFVFYSANDGIDPKYYLKVGSGNVLERVSGKENATHWTLETPAVHAETMINLRNVQVETATEEFLEPISTLAMLRNRLNNNDYDRDTIVRASYLPYTPVSVQEETNNNISVYEKTVSDLVPGFYCLNVKAYYRTGPNVRTYDAYNNGYDNPVAFVKVVDESDGGKTASTQIASIFDSPGDMTGNASDFQIKRKDDKDELKTFYYPNTTATATAILDKPRYYDNDVYIFVHPKAGGKGKITYSIQSPSNSNDSNWLCYKNITLTRLYRKEFAFTKAGDWNDGANWEYGGGTGVVPDSIHKVLIQAPATISGANVGVYSVSFESAGSVTIGANASLSVREGGISGATSSNLILNADEKGQTGTLRLYPGITAPNATVKFHSVVANDPKVDTWEWQYIGSPITEETASNNEAVFYNCWLYKHDAAKDEWTNAGNWNKMTPFRGYAFTRNNKTGSRPSTGPEFSYSGQLNPAVSKEFLLTYVGETPCENFIANSWTAPIALKNLKEDDFYNVEKTIYVYPAKDKGSVTAIGPFTAEYTGNDTISAMQGFSVKATGANPTLRLDYERLVWESKIKTNGPVKAPARVGRRSAETDLISRVCIDMLSADSFPNHLYLLEKEGEGFSRAYNEGYDAPKYFVDGLPAIYTYEEQGPHLAVSATDSLLGTYLAINTNGSQTYTLIFNKIIGEGLGLRDLVTDMVVPIIEGGKYTFAATPNTTNQLRFVVEEYVAPEPGNGGTTLDNLSDDRMRIWQEGNLLSVVDAGARSELRLYDAAGNIIIQKSFNNAVCVNISALQSGVYLAVVNDTKIVRILK